jgi:hypothetical protein
MEEQGWGRRRRCKKKKNYMKKRERSVERGGVWELHSKTDGAVWKV